jgi:hypothetical protein
MGYIERKKTYNDEHPAAVAASEMQPTIHGLGLMTPEVLLGAAGDWAVTTAAAKMARKS